MAFVSKSILSDMSIVTLTFLSFPFAWNIFLSPLIYNLCVSCALKWVSFGQHIVGFCLFFTGYATLCLLIGAFSPLTFKAVVNRYVFISILNFVFPFILYFFFAPFIFHFVAWWFCFVLYLCLLLFVFCDSL